MSATTVPAGQPENREVIDSLGPPPSRLWTDRAYWHAELTRRVEAVENGTMRTYSIEETMAYLRQVAAEGQTP